MEALFRCRRSEEFAVLRAGGSSGRRHLGGIFRWLGNCAPRRVGRHASRHTLHHKGRSQIEFRILPGVRPLGRIVGRDGHRRRRTATRWMAPLQPGRRTRLERNQRQFFHGGPRQRSLGGHKSGIEPLPGSRNGTRISATRGADYVRIVRRRGSGDRSESKDSIRRPVHSHRVYGADISGRAGSAVPVPLCGSRWRLDHDRQPRAERATPFARKLRVCGNGA